MSHPDREESLAGTSTVTASIAAELRPVSLDSARAAALKRRVVERVRSSIEAHRDLTTVRREDRAWSVVAPGVTQCVLQESGGMRIQVLRVDAHACVPWPPATLAEEVLVIEGSLLVDRHGATTCLPRFHQRVVDRTGPVELRAGSDGARLYMRCRVVEVDVLPAGEAKWWTEAQNAPSLAAQQPHGWSAFLEGVDAVDLLTHDGVASMLLRIGPGVRLPDHGHSLDEDCFMLEGDMFLGDVLMRAGDYQLARAGGEHVGIASDAGGVFYFHGAIPGSASEEAT